MPKQLSQFDDCMAGNFDAIIVGPISEAGLDKKFAEGVKAGKVIISTVNPVSKSTVTSKMTVDFTTMGVQTGDYLVDYLKDKKANVVTFAAPPVRVGPRHSSTASRRRSRTRATSRTSTTSSANSGVAVQFGLIQNALQAYPDMTNSGDAPAAEAAVGGSRSRQKGHADHVLL